MSGGATKIDWDEVGRVARIACPAWPISNSARSAFEISGFAAGEEIERTAFDFASNPGYAK